MNYFLNSSQCWGSLLTIGIYSVGVVLQKYTKLKWINPMLFSSIFIIILLSLAKISYSDYKASADPINWLLLPGTVCLAIPLYEKIELLKDNFFAIMLGVMSGTITSLCSIIVLSILLKIEYRYTVTLLPKSVTAAIGTEIAVELGGIASLATAIIIMTGMVGHLVAKTVFKLFRITDPIAKGISLGTAAHALGTAKALEIGEIEGAMSSLALVVAGILTAIMAPICSGWFL